MLNRALALPALVVAIACAVHSCSPPTIEQRETDERLAAWQAWQQEQQAEEKAAPAPEKAKPTPKPKAKPKEPASPKAKPKGEPTEEQPEPPPAKAPKPKAPDTEPPEPKKPEPKQATPKPPEPKKTEPEKAESEKPEPKESEVERAEPEEPAAKVPEQEEAPKPEETPAEAETTEPEGEEAPEVEEQPPPPAPELFLFLPQQRTGYVAGETAEVTLVVASAAALPDAQVVLSLKNNAGAAWHATDRLGSLPAGRHAMTYGIEVAACPPGTYTLSARLGEASFGSRELTFGPSVPETHFPLAAWVGKRPRQATDTARWRQVLGLNTVLLSRRSPWRTAPAHRLSGRYAEDCERLRADPQAKPLEMSTGAPPFVRAAGLLTAAGLRWINAAAVTGDEAGDWPAKHPFAAPRVAAGARQRMEHRLLAERQFGNCRGVHLLAKTALPPSGKGEEANPFGVQARLDAFKARAGLEKFDWKQGAKAPEPWRQFLTFRAELLRDTLADWSQAARALEPDYLTTAGVAQPSNLARGIAPPLLGESLSHLTLELAPDGMTGMSRCYMALDLFRMGNRDKPLWIMPRVDTAADLDEIRACIHLAMARKVNGVIYPPGLDYHYDQADAGPAASALLAGIGGINQRLAELGDFLLALEKPRELISILYSQTEHMARMGQNPTESPRAEDYSWRLFAAHQACMMAHFPASFLSERELLAGEGAPSKAILVVGLTQIEPEVKQRLEAHAAAGGVVLTDPTTTVEINGAQPLKVEFPSYPDYREKMQETTKTDEALALEMRDEIIRRQLFIPILGSLRVELKKHLERDYTVSSPTVLVSEQNAGDARYYFVVNNSQSSALYRGLKYELQPARTRLILRNTRKLYDVVGGGSVEAPTPEKYPVVSLILPAGGMDIIADLPRKVGGVYIRRARRRGGSLDLSAYVIGGKEKKPDWVTNFLGALWDAVTPEGRPDVMNAAVPIEVIVRDPNGEEWLHLYRAHTPDGYRESIPFPDGGMPGTWTVTVRERLAGTSAKDTFSVSARTPDWASRRGSVAAFDGERVARLLRSQEPLWIIAGTEAEAEAVQPLAESLATEERPVEVRLARDVARPRTLGSEEADRYLSPAPGNSPMPDIPHAAVLFGNAATHPLIRAVHNYGLLPRQISPDYPGPGAALVCWLTSVFEPHPQVVVAAAADEAGVQRALEVLTRAAGGSAPETAWTGLGHRGTWPTEEEGEPQAPVAEVLEPQWSRRTLDNPTSAAAALAGDFFVFGFHDGQAISYDTTGRQEWTHRCTSRVHDVSISLDGAWHGAASFPEVVAITARGRPHWQVGLNDSRRRADFSAIAIAPDGMVTVAGTRQGGLVGIDQSGMRLFAMGVELKERESPIPVAILEPDRKPPEPEGKDQATLTAEAERLGSVNAIATAGTDLAVVGCERETLILALGGQDPGNEVWASGDYQNIAAVAVNPEHQLAALASRDGYVACVELDGTPRWKTPAEGYVMSVAFQGLSENLLAASLNGGLVCYDKNGQVLWRHESPVGYRFVASSSGGDVIAAAPLTGRAILLNGNGEIFAKTPPLKGVVRAMAFSAGGNYLLIGTSANQVTFFKHERVRLKVEDEL